MEIFCVCKPDVDKSMTRMCSLEARLQMKTDFEDLKKQRSPMAELHAAEVKCQRCDSL